MARVLYLSYDGMTDPLGQSQVLPYLSGLSKLGHEIHVLSFEKPARKKNYSDETAAKMKAAGLHWHPLKYHKKPPVVSTLLDLWLMIRKAKALHQKHPFRFTHCRSYIAGLASYALYKGGVPYLFDMRGFWADERVDGGLWNLKNPLYLLIYRSFKRWERMLLEHCFAAVCLTQKAAEIMSTWKILGLREKTSVIPCCADLAKFKHEPNKDWKQELGIPHSARILVYSGSIGTWYLLDDMLRFYRSLLKANPDYYFCLFTPDQAEPILRRAEKIGIPRVRVKIRSLRHDEMPSALSASDLAICFIRPSFSKQSSSPTKLGEYLGVGLPVVANSGVGDMDSYFAENKIGALVTDMSDETLNRVARSADTLLALPKAPIRKAAEEIFSLERGLESYAKLYATGERTVHGLR